MPSRDQAGDDPALDVGQAEAPALVEIGEAFVIGIITFLVALKVLNNQQ